MVGCCLFNVYLYGRCIWNFKIGSVFSSAKLKMEVDKFCLCRNIEYFCFINNWKSASQRHCFLEIIKLSLNLSVFRCYTADVLHVKRFENRQNSPGGCFPKICTIYHYCKMYRKSFKRCQIIFFHKKLNARM